MRKRNKPILLATLLVVFVAAAVGMNIMMTPKSAAQMQEEAMEHQAEHKEEPKALGDPRKSNNSSAASAAASALGRKPMSANVMPEGPANASIKKQTSSIPKPKPNATMTSGQWYTKEYGYKGEGK